MVAIIFLAVIILLFVFIGCWIFVAKKSINIFIAMGVAICLSIPALITSVVITKKFRVIEKFFDSWGVNSEIYFYSFFIFLISLSVLLIHRAEFKYSLYKTLIALAAVLAVMYIITFPVLLLAACAMGDCL